MAAKLAKIIDLVVHQMSLCPLRLFPIDRLFPFQETNPAQYGCIIYGSKIERYKQQLETDFMPFEEATQQCQQVHKCLKIKED